MELFIPLYIGDSPAGTYSQFWFLGYDFYPVNRAAVFRNNTLILINSLNLFLSFHLCASPIQTSRISATAVLPPNTFSIVSLRPVLTCTETLNLFCLTTIEGMLK